jgi:hypothetical protein
VTLKYCRVSPRDTKTRSQAFSLLTQVLVGTIGALWERS